MEPFVEQLKRLCREHPTRAKWVFVPSHSMGHTIGDRLVLEGTDWANLRFVTPFDIALRMGAPFLVERNIDPSGEGLGPALIMRLLIGLSEGREEGGYFRPLAHQPELARALWSTITELRMAGLRASDLDAGAFTSAEKHAELKALVEEYEAFLVKNNVGDRATVFTEAVNHLDWCPIQPQDCWTSLPDAIWSPLEHRILEMMPGERIAPEAFNLPGATKPRRLPADGVARVTPGASAPLAFTQSPDLWTLGPLDPRTVSFFSAGGSEAEIEEVFRRILASGQTLDQVEICAANGAATSLIWEKCLRYEWPVTMAEGVSAAMTRPGRALVAFAYWIEDDLAAGRLRKLLQSGDIALPKGMTFGAGRAARILVKAQAAWGRDTYRLALARLAKSDRTRANRDDIGEDERDRLTKSAAEADEVSAWIEQIVGAIPKVSSGDPVGQRTPGGASGPVGQRTNGRASGPGAPEKTSSTTSDTIPLQALVDCAIRFVETTTARTSALDGAAAAALVEALRDLKALGDFHCTLAQALRFMTERVESVHIGADRPRPGHLHVSNFRTAALSSRRVFFIVGLEEGRVFPSAFEDPILLDEERVRLDEGLVRANDRIDEAVFGAVSRLAAASANPNVAMTLSYSCRDLREFRETHASWLILQAYRIASGNPTARFSDLHAHMGAPKSCVPETAAGALGPSRWWLHGVGRAGHNGRAAVLGHYASLARGQKAQEERASALFTEFDGYVPEAGVILDPANPTRVVSPTQLEDAAACPYRHFLRRGLRVEAIESGDRDRDIWLGHLLRGSLLHDLYAGLMRRCRKEKRGVTVPADADWLVAEGRRTLAELTSEMPPPSADVGDRETEGFLADLKLFADAEAKAAAAGAQPLAFEVAFGRGESDEDEPMSRLDPITVDLGGGAKLRIAGRIDRIDQVGTGAKATFEIIDYKTGGYFAPAWQGTFAGGSRLQHALYGLAAVEILKAVHKAPTVSGATYYFTSAKGLQSRKQIAAQSLAKVTEVLSDIRGVIRDGLFIHAHDEESCKFCDYGYACGKDAHATAGTKHADPNLAPFLKLGNHG